MDDFFQIVIFLLIIISFIAPIFRKKDQQKKQQQQQRQRFPFQNDVEEPAVNVSSMETEQKDYDVLKELENFFKVGNAEETLQEEFVETNKVPEINTQTTGNQSIWDKKKAEVERVVKSLDKKIEDQAKQFQEEMVYQEKTLSNDFVLRLKKNIRKPATLKEYILIAEIIGKPKSLRR